MPILEFEAFPEPRNFQKERDLLQSRTPNDLAAGVTDDVGSSLKISLFMASHLPSSPPQLSYSQQNVMACVSVLEVYNRNKVKGSIAATTLDNLATSTKSPFPVLSIIWFRGPLDSWNRL